MNGGMQKLPVFEKVGYSVGDAAANFVYQTVILFQLNFYTDTVGIAAATAGSLLSLRLLQEAKSSPSGRRWA